MNLYDPMDSIVYRHMNQPANRWLLAVREAPETHRLPAGYANRSPRTYLRGTGRKTMAAPTPGPLAV